MGGGLFLHWFVLGFCLLSLIKSQEFSWQCHAEMACLCCTGGAPLLYSSARVLERVAAMGLLQGVTAREGESLYCDPPSFAVEIKAQSDAGSSKSKLSACGSSHL